MAFCKNIKANATHIEGSSPNHAHAYGFINEGMYSLIVGNNIVGEWAGMAIGLENKGEFTVVTSNKILSTHSMVGKTIRNTGRKANISNNIITSTTKNVRLIEHHASDSIISNNIMEVIPPRSQCESGCGIYAAYDHMKNNIVTDNIITNPINCGIFVEAKIGAVRNNVVLSENSVFIQSTPEDKNLFALLNKYK